MVVAGTGKEFLLYLIKEYINYTYKSTEKQFP